MFIFWKVNLFSDSLLNGIYVLLGLYGWYNWKFGDPHKKQLPVSTTPLPRLLLYLAAATVATFAWAELVKAYYPQASYLYADSATTCFSLLAQWLLARKKLENWLLWLVIDVVCIGLYILKDLYLTAGLFAVYLVLCVVGYQKWKAELAQF